MPPLRGFPNCLQLPTAICLLPTAFVFVRFHEGAAQAAVVLVAREHAEPEVEALWVWVAPEVAEEGRTHVRLVVLARVVVRGGGVEQRPFARGLPAPEDESEHPPTPDELMSPLRRADVEVVAEHLQSPHELVPHRRAPAFRLEDAVDEEA